MGSSSDWKKRLKVLLCQEDKKKRKCTSLYAVIYICVSLFSIRLAMLVKRTQREIYIYIHVVDVCVGREWGNMSRSGWIGLP